MIERIVIDIVYCKRIISYYCYCSLSIANKKIELNEMTLGL